jgi:hypothetical protein
VRSPKNASICCTTRPGRRTAPSSRRARATTRSAAFPPAASGCTTASGGSGTEAVSAPARRRVAEEHRRAGVLARRRAICTSARTSPAAVWQYNKRRHRGAVRHPAPRSRHRRGDQTWSPAPAARCGRRRRRTAAGSPSSAAGAHPGQPAGGQGPGSAAARPWWTAPSTATSRKPAATWATTRLRLAAERRGAGLLGPRPLPSGRPRRRAIAADPVHVRADKRVHPASVWRSRSMPTRSPVRMLRWTQYSPDGRLAVYQALGYLWVHDLERDERRRLTRQTDHWEFHPSFSPDGRFVVFTTLERRGPRQRAHRAGRPRPRQVLTREPGHYVEPASRRTAAASPSARSPAATSSRRPGLRARRALPGARRRQQRTWCACSTAAARRSFSADGERLLYTDQENTRLGS